MTPAFSSVTMSAVLCGFTDPVHSDRASMAPPRRPQPEPFIVHLHAGRFSDPISSDRDVPTTIEHDSQPRGER
jgi:hypothetical protein